MKKTLMIAGAMALVAHVSAADTISFYGQGVNPEGGAALAASAVFEVSGSQLLVTLANTAAGPATRPSDMLTGVFFDLANANVLTPVSATLVGDWHIVLGGDPWTHPLLPDVGGEFAFEGDISSGFSGAQYGIASAGVGGYFGPGARFNSNTLWPPAAPNGMDFGMASAAGLMSHPGMQGDPLIVGGAVQFVFNYAGALSIEDISNVNWQYGTSASNPNISIVPEPSTMSLLGMGMAGLAVVRRFRKKQT